MVPKQNSFHPQKVINELTDCNQPLWENPRSQTSLSEVNKQLVALVTTLIAFTSKTLYNST